MRVMIVWADTGETTCGDAFVGENYIASPEEETTGETLLVAHTIRVIDHEGNACIITRGPSVEGFRERCTWHDQETGWRVHLWLALGVD